MRLYTQPGVTPIDTLTRGEQLRRPERPAFGYLHLDLAGSVSHPDSGIRPATWILTHPVRTSCFGKPFVSRLVVSASLPWVPHVPSCPSRPFRLFLRQWIMCALWFSLKCTRGACERQQPFPFLNLLVKLPFRGCDRGEFFPNCAKRVSINRISLSAHSHLHPKRVDMVNAQGAVPFTALIFQNMFA